MPYKKIQMQDGTRRLIEVPDTEPLEAAATDVEPAVPSVPLQTFPIQGHWRDNLDTPENRIIYGSKPL